MGRALGSPLDRAGPRAGHAGADAAGRPEVFVIGDLAALEQDGRPVPGVAPAAMQMGRHAAANIARAVGARPSSVSLPRQGHARHHRPQRGRRAVRGRNSPASWPGPPGSPSTFFLIGFRNRFVVMVTWAWAYLTYQRSTRRSPPGPYTAIRGPRLASAAERVDPAQVPTPRDPGDHGLSVGPGLLAQRPARGSRWAAPNRPSRPCRWGSTRASAG